VVTELRLYAKFGIPDRTEPAVTVCGKPLLQRGFFNKKGPSVVKEEQPKEFESTSVQTDGPLMV